MPKFAPVGTDSLALTRAYNALHEGRGTFIGNLDLDAFTQAWSGQARAFISDDGFLGLELTDNSQASLCAAPFSDAFVEPAGALVRELLRAFGLSCLRAAASTPAGDAFLESLGMHYDGLLRRLTLVQNGAGPTWLDVSFWSMIPSDLDNQPKEP